MMDKQEAFGHDQHNAAVHQTRANSTAASCDPDACGKKDETSTASTNNSASTSNSLTASDNNTSASANNTSSTTNNSTAVVDNSTSTSNFTTATSKSNFSISATNICTSTANNAINSHEPMVETCDADNTSQYEPELAENLGGLKSTKEYSATSEWDNFSVAEKETALDEMDKRSIQDSQDSGLCDNTESSSTVGEASLNACTSMIGLQTISNRVNDFEIKATPIEEASEADPIKLGYTESSSNPTSEATTVEKLSTSTSSTSCHYNPSISYIPSAFVPSTSTASSSTTHSEDATQVIELGSVTYNTINPKIGHPDEPWVSRNNMGVFPLPDLTYGNCA